MKNDGRVDVTIRRARRLGHLSAWALIAASCSLFGGGEAAGQLIQLPLRPGGASVSVEDAARGLARPESKKRTLRCWQHGELIVERRVNNMPDDATRVVRIGPGDEPEAQLFDLRTSTCLLQ
jgi:hypothetical protein